MRFVSSTYDQENRLTKWEKGTKRSEWNYNGLGLQRELREYENGSLIKTERYVYDGTQIVAILNAANTTVKTFTRGLDLSGSMEGAGGIGGLLGMKDGTNTAYYFADGNGNVAALYGEQGESRAVYQYDGFGNKVASSGSMSESNPFQWSSKYFHQPSGLVAYEYRFYSPQLGRWINRDPIGERGGLNLYGMIDNDAVNDYDILGQQPGNSKPRPPFRHAEEFQENVTWTYTRHRIEVKCYTGNINEIRQFAYDQIRRFANFDSGTARVRVTESGVAYFDLLGVKGFGSDLINALEVPVYLNFNDEITSLDGQTAGRHQLVGIRRWAVSPISETPPVVLLETSAHERPRGSLNAAGMSMARRDQVEIWKGYLERTAKAITDKYKGVASEVIVEGPTDSASPGPNPFY